MDAVLELVRQRPGMTVAELAEALGVSRSRIYRVMRRLSAERKIERKGRRWIPTA
jgi:DNA-binding IclR family transcriptional regulator